MKKLLGIVILIAIFGSLSIMIYHDFNSHNQDTIEVGIADTEESVWDEIIHYVLHIIICLTVCTMLHNPAHKFSEWIKRLLGIKSHKGHDDGNCH